MIFWTFKRGLSSNIIQPSMLWGLYILEYSAKLVLAIFTET